MFLLKCYMEFNILSYIICSIVPTWHLWLSIPFMFTLTEMLKIIEGINVSLKGTLWSSAGDAGDVIHIPANRFMQFH